MRTTRAAAKRAAMDDGGDGPEDNGPNKRQALANISNGAPQRPSSCTKSKTGDESTSSRSKTRGSGGGRTRGGKRTSSRGCVVTTQSTSSVQTDTETASHVPTPEVNVEEQTEVMILDSCTGDCVALEESTGIASPERRTGQNLHISSKLPAGPSVTSSDTRDATLESGRGGWTSSLGYSCIDNNPGDPQMCTVYAADIYQHLKHAEVRRRPNTNFIEAIQKDITSNMRGILVDWLVEVAEEYKLVPDTLYLTCSFIDRYLSGNVVSRSRLQLLGVSCMLIAAKYEEIYAPQVEEFCYITDNTYRREEVLEMEKKILNDLHFELSIPTTKSFLRRFIRAAQVSLEVPSLQLEFLGNYVAELTLMDYSFLAYLPSMIAASAVFLAKLTMEPSKHPWTLTLQHYTGYSSRQLKTCVLALHSILWSKGGALPAIREKYSQSKFQSVSQMSAPPEVDLHYFEDMIS